MSNKYPLLFKPILKDYLWGGRNLEKLGRTLPENGVIAESWEIASHKDGETLVENGSLAGSSLADLLENWGLDLVGERCAWALERNKFPLLVKILDANKALSVQVHPKDDYAAKHEGNELGKTEMWVVLKAKPGANVILGVSQGTTPDAFREAITTGNLEPYLHRVKVKAGDHICVPAGSLHALMEGLLIAEVQQNSNTTYRVYDWNRVDAQGNARPLHIDKAMDVINFKQVQPQLKPATLIEDKGGLQTYELCRNPYFVTERITFKKDSCYYGKTQGSLELWGALEGSVRINDVPLTAVQFSCLPAALGKYSVKAQEDAILLRTYVPEND